MNFNFFKKKNTGWELSDLMGLLKTEPAKLLAYTKSYTLSSVNTLHDKFVVIRKFAAHELDGKINMLNLSDVDGKDHYPISVYGMTLVNVSTSGASSTIVYLPNTLEYKKVTLDNETISIYHSNGITITNFKEIQTLTALNKLNEQEILNRFSSLHNFVAAQEENTDYKADYIEHDFFGKLMFNEDLDLYEVTKHDVEYFFCTTTLEQLQLNFKNTEGLIAKLKTIEEQMIDELIVLKNEDWLGDSEREISKEEFKKEVKLYAINTFEKGNAELYYKANNLFFGHDIQTSINNEHIYKNSTIVG